MAWSLTESSRHLVGPSIYAEFKGKTKDLNEAYANVKWTVDECDGTEEYDEILKDARGMDRGEKLEYLIETAQEYATTTNGGFNLYLADRWTEIPIVDETSDAYYEYYS